MYDFPSSPTNGQVANGYTYNGILWAAPIPAVTTSFNTFEYMFDTGTAEPPSSANVRFDNATYTAVTKIWVHEISSIGKNNANAFSVVGAGNRLFVQDKDDDTKWVSYDCSGPGVDKGVYWEFPVAWRQSGPSALAAQRILFNVVTPAGGGGGGGAGVTDGDKGDIVVSGSGASWMLDTAVVTAAAKTVLDDTTTAAMLTTLGAAPTVHTHTYASLTSIPSTFAPSPHVHAESEITNLVTDLAAKAPLASPVFTGDPQAPTPSTADNDTSIATTGYVQTAIAGMGVGGMSTAEYTYSTTITAPPSTGQLRGNNATFSLITQFFLHETNAVGVDISNALKLVAAGVKILVQEKGNSANVSYYTVSGPAVDNGVYFTVPVTYTATGSGGTITAGRVMFCAFGVGSNNMVEAPTDGQDYSRRGSTASWVLSLPTGGTTAQYLRGDRSWQTLPPAGISDALANSFTYGRKSNLWVEVTPEAPANGKLHGRIDKAWAEVPAAGGGGIPEPVNDGDVYARKGNGTWVATFPLDDYNDEQGAQDDRLTALEGSAGVIAPLILNQEPGQSVATITLDDPLSGGPIGNAAFRATSYGGISIELCQSSGTMIDTTGTCYFGDVWTSTVYADNIQARNPWPTSAEAPNLVLDSVSNRISKSTASGGISQAAADLRYEPLDSAYTKSEADAKYLTSAAADTAYVNVGGDTMTGRLAAAAGTQALPSLGFTTDTASGFFRKATNSISVSCNNFECMNWTASGKTSFYAQMLSADGSAATPAYSFTSAATVGMYQTSGTLNWATAGVLRLSLSTTLLTSTLPIVLPADPASALHAATKQYVDLRAPLADPAFTGVPTAPTAAAGTNTTQIATTAFANAAYGAKTISTSTPSGGADGDVWYQVT